MTLDHIDRAILQYMFRAQDWVNTNEVSRAVQISWLTADRHLEMLCKLGYVQPGHGGRTRYWRINR